MFSLEKKKDSFFFLSATENSRYTEYVILGTLHDPQNALLLPVKSKDGRQGFISNKDFEMLWASILSSFSLVDHDKSNIFEILRR